MVASYIQSRISASSIDGFSTPSFSCWSYRSYGKTSTSPLSIQECNLFSILFVGELYLSSTFEFCCLVIIALYVHYYIVHVQLFRGGGGWRIRIYFFRCNSHANSKFMMQVCSSNSVGETTYVLIRIWH